MRRGFSWYAKLTLSPVLGLLSTLFSLAQESEKLEFNKHIRPILSNNCYFCHGPDKKNLKAKLSLDKREIAIEKGAIVIGDPEASELIKRIVSSDPEETMPPPETHKKVSAAELALLKRWINEGAEYQAHWSYGAIKNPAVPAIAGAAHPIDALLQDRLQEMKVSVSEPADRATLIRRLTLDLTGLPPSEVEVRAFLADPSEDSTARVIDRLLASPHYGERMAVPWLDLVRFSDTVGYHGDQNQRIFPYRDYVINSFNQNKTFDQFTIEQLAGDLLPNPTTEQLVATGFNRLNMMTREGGAQPKEYLAKYAADRVRTVSATWLGSTMACSECHDHKYDPFSIKDFYSMAAFFADVKQWGVYTDYGYTPNPELKGFTNDHPFPPEIRVDSPYLQKKLTQQKQNLEAFVKTASVKAQNQPDYITCRDAWLKEAQSAINNHLDGWVPTLPVKASGNEGTVGNLQTDHTVSYTGETKPKETLSLTVKPQTRLLTHVRLELLPDPQSKEGAITRNGSEFNKLSLKLKRASGDLAIDYALPNHSTIRYFDTQEIFSVHEQWAADTTKLKDPHYAIYWLKEPVELNADEEITLTISGAPQLGRVRVSTSPFAGEKPSAEVIAELQSKNRVAEQERELDRAYVLSTGLRQKEVWQSLLAQRQQIMESREGQAWTQVTVVQEPLTTRVLPRGNWMDESGPIVVPQTPEFLPVIARPAQTEARQTRLDLAQWLVAKENPLTARVLVNRLWKLFFGQALSTVTEDLGAQGEWPSHPELLDWLASEMHRSGWDVKGMVRLMVTSQAYQRSSRIRPDLQNTDPFNRLLSRQNSRRLEAEFIRDNALSIAGLINLDIGGPSAKPYQPAGYYESLNFPMRDYHHDIGSEQYRRGVYMHWQRTFLHPMLANFDAPGREECTSDRSQSNTPQQALTLLNDPSFVEAARALAQRGLTTLAATASPTQLIQWLYQQALARPPAEAELKSLTEFYQTQLTHYQKEPELAQAVVKNGIAPKTEGLDAVTLATWTSVARVIMNLHETITRY